MELVKSQRWAHYSMLSTLFNVEFITHVHDCFHNLHWLVLYLKGPCTICQGQGTHYPCHGGTTPVPTEDPVQCTYVAKDIFGRAVMKKGCKGVCLVETLVRIKLCVKNVFIFHSLVCRLLGWQHDRVTKVEFAILGSQFLRGCVFPYQTIKQHLGCQLNILIHKNILW